MKVKPIIILLIATLCLWVSVVGCTPENRQSGERKSEDGVRIGITVGTQKFSATLADNDTAEAFKALLPLTLDMSELNGNEKYNYLSDSLPTNAFKPGTINTGDLMLYGSSCVVLFYKTFSSSYSYTRIGWVDDTKGLASALGGGSVTVVFEISDASDGNDKSGDEDNPDQPDKPNQPSETDPSEGADQPDQPDREEEEKMYITINGSKMEMTLAENSSVKALVELLKQGDITYTANDYGGFEKVGSLGHTLPTNHAQISTSPGDVILYQTDQIVLFYGSNSWSYTRIGKIKYSSQAELENFLGAGCGMVQVTFSLK